MRIDFDRDTLEADLEATSALFISLHKSLIDSGYYEHADTYDLISPNLESQTSHYYICRCPNDTATYNSMVAAYNVRTRTELLDYLHEYREREKRTREVKNEEKRRREEEIIRKVQQRRREEEEARRRKKEEERKRKEEEERKREEKRRQEEAKRKEQDKQNREQLSKIQAEWEEHHSLKQAPGPQPQTDCIYCTSCGTANAKTAKFCKKCGTQLQISCPSCGGLVRMGSKFCGKCGTPVK